MRRGSENLVTQHRGVDIFVGNDGTFFTREDSEYGLHKAKSMADIKKAIDGAGAAQQGPEKALVLGHGQFDDDEDTQVKEVKCGAIVKNGYGGREVWITNLKSGDRSKASASSVYEDTPENREVIKNIIQLRKAMKGLKQQHTAHMKKLVSIIQLQVAK